jgi:hypothetical protein
MSDQPRKLPIEPLEVSISLRRQACEAIKRAITDMDLYGQPGEIRLDERQLCRRSWGSAARRSARRCPFWSRKASSARSRAAASSWCASRSSDSDRDDHRLGGDREHGGAAGGDRCVD